MDYGNSENRYGSSNRGGGGYGGGGRGGEDGGYSRGNNYSSASERTVIQIPGTHIGKIIGPAGRHINDMQRTYNVRIQINKMANSDGTKDAEISGNNLNDIQDAIKAINEQIEAPFERRQGGGGDRGPRSYGGGEGGGYRGGQSGGFRPRGERSYGGGDRSYGGFSRDRDEN